jgi:uncharacterized membrane protein YhiD involved in acid resistance
MNTVFGPLTLSVSWSSVALGAEHLFVAILCGFLLSVVYRKTYRGVSYSSTFDRSLISLAVITAIVIMAVGNSLARAFGLVGAMSIVRFRTALKDPQDLVFIFCSLSVGLAAGVGFHGLAIGGTLVLSGLIYGMEKLHFGMIRPRELVLELAVAPEPGQDPEAVYGSVLRRFCRKQRLLSARSSATDDGMSLTFFVELTEDGDVPAFTRSLREIPAVIRANVFSDEEP